MKKCPFCAEEIQSEAIKCRYCGERLDLKTKTDDSAVQQRNHKNLIGQGYNQPDEAPKAQPSPELSSQQSTVITAPLEKPRAKAMSYAGFWKRVAASIIDTIVITIGTFVIGFVFGLIWFAGGTHDTTALRWQGFFLGVIIYWLYFAVMESTPKQATLGKMALGIKVTDLKGSKIDFGKATGRYFGKIISALILLIGYIMVAFTQKKQGLHDIMAGCLVVNRASENATSDDDSMEKMPWDAEINKTRIIATVVFVVLFIAAFISSYIQGYLTGSLLFENIGYMIGFTSVPLIAYIVYMIYPKHNGTRYVYYILAILFILICVFGGILYKPTQNASVSAGAPRVEAPAAPELAWVGPWLNPDGTLNAEGRKQREQLNRDIRNIGEAKLSKANKAIQLNPNDADAYLERGAAYATLNQPQRAIENYNEAIRLKPDAETHIERGFFYVLLGQYQLAIEDYNEAIRLKPDYAAVYSNRGYAYGLLGDNERRCQDEKKACALGYCGTLEKSKENGYCR